MALCAGAAFSGCGGTSGSAGDTAISSPSTQATRLAVTTQPSGAAQSGVSFSQQPVVQLRDASNNPVSQAGVAIAAAVASGGGTLGGTTSATTDANGMASFTNLAVTGSGAQTLRFSASGLTPATSSTIMVSTSGGAGSTLLFQESFDDTNFGARGWYDLPSGGITSVTTAEHIPGSAGSLQVNFPQGPNTTPTPSTAARHLFTPTNSVYLRFWVKHSTNWVGSGLTYHPHEFYFLTTEDAQYAGPASNYLTTYVEENFQSNGGYAVMSAQDAKNIDASHINQDLTSVTEKRAVSGCNGEPDNTPTTCYQSGSAWYNGKTWKSTQPVFQQAAGSGYKGDWHKVEAYFQLNSIVNGIGQRDGVAQYWVDGALVIDRHDLMFRTGVHTGMQFNQLVMGPYMGSGSPVSQTLWYDDLVVMTARPASP